MDKDFDPADPLFSLEDPFAGREAEKYDKPIPSRELILELLKKTGKPLRRQQIAQYLGVVSDEGLEALRRRLRAMERDGQLLFNRRQKYCLVDSQALIAGRVLGHSDGFGFVQPDDGTDDLFLSPRQMLNLMHNDRVLVRVDGVDRRGRREAAVVEVLERNTQHVVGRLIKEHGLFYVAPDNRKITRNILIPADELGKAKKGQIVVAKIIQQPVDNRQALGRITEVIGKHMAPGMEIQVALRSHDLPFQWPDDVIKESEAFSTVVKPSSWQDREDIRHLPLVTIDGEDARDFDDAVFCKKTPKGFKLYVAIADVAHYVAVNSALDREAHKRSTSVYFPEQVIPMLPEVLSNGLCSLNPHVDRLCMVAEMILNESGEVQRSRFYNAVMQSHARLTYTEVASILVDHHKGLRKKYHELVPHLQCLYELYRCLQTRRDARGAMDFDTQETQIIFGPERKIEKIVPTQRNDAHRLIEECMILANTAAAKFLQRKKVPHLLRIHDGPGSEKLLSLKTFLNELGLHLGGGDNPTPTDYMNLIHAVKDRLDSHLIQTVLLRSMSQAVYSPEQKGHFGLALEAYTHFTSPIRRYPDLLIHRAIKHSLSGKPVKNFVYGVPDMVILGEHCSANERRADEATRDVMAWLKCEYMMDKIGEQFEGIISAVTGFGFFVELSEIYVEGLVHISNLPAEFFHFDSLTRQLIGERTGKRYRLGDKVTVIVARVDLDEKKIDFELAGFKGAFKERIKASVPKPKKHQKVDKAKSDKSKKSPKTKTKFKSKKKK